MIWLEISDIQFGLVPNLQIHFQIPISFNNKFQIICGYSLQSFDMLVIGETHNRFDLVTIDGICENYHLFHAIVYLLIWTEILNF